MESVYDLFQRGTALLEGGDFHSATVPLALARDLAPDKTSIREALGRQVAGAGERHGGRVKVAALQEGGAALEEVVHRLHDGSV